MENFIARLQSLPNGYSTGLFDKQKYAVTISSSADGRRYKLYGEELGGDDFVSLNLYIPTNGKPQLKPCEMPAEKVINFVLSYQPSTD